MVFRLVRVEMRPLSLSLPDSDLHCTKYLIMALFPLNGEDQEILAVRLLCSSTRTSRGGSGGSARGETKRHVKTQDGIGGRSTPKRWRSKPTLYYKPNIHIVSTKCICNKARKQGRVPPLCRLDCDLRGHAFLVHQFFKIVASGK